MHAFDSTRLPLRLATVLLTGSALVSSLPAMAAAGELAEDAEAAPGQLHEITVTAQRRVENSQDVPLAIKSVDADALAQTGYTDFTDIQYMVPGVQYDPTQGAAFQIRGVGSRSFDFSNAKSVSVVVDGVVMDGQRANGLNQPFSCLNVDTGITVGKGSFGCIAHDDSRVSMGKTSLPVPLAVPAPALACYKRSKRRPLTMIRILIASLFALVALVIDLGGNFYIFLKFVFCLKKTKIFLIYILLNFLDI